MHACTLSIFASFWSRLITLRSVAASHPASYNLKAWLICAEIFKSTGFTGKNFSQAYVYRYMYIYIYVCICMLLISFRRIPLRHFCSVRLRRGIAGLTGWEVTSEGHTIPAYFYSKFSQPQLPEKKCLRQLETITESIIGRCVYIFVCFSKSVFFLYSI